MNAGTPTVLIGLPEWVPPGVCGTTITSCLPACQSLPDFNGSFIFPWVLYGSVKYYLEVLILGSSCIDMPLPIRSMVQDLNHSWSVLLDTSPRHNHKGHNLLAYEIPVLGDATGLNNNESIHFLSVVYLIHFPIQVGITPQQAIHKL